MSKTENTQAADNGTAAAAMNPMSEKLGQLDISKLANLLREPNQDNPKKAEPVEAEEKQPDDAVTEVIEESDQNLKSETDNETESDNEQEVEAQQEDNVEKDELPKGVKKRIDKLTAKRHELEEQLKQKEQEIESLRSSTQKQEEVRQAPTADNPYQHLDNQSAIEAEIKNARNIREWCEMNPDGAVVSNKDGTETEYSSEDVRRIKSNTLRAIEEHLPKQLSYVNARQQLDPVAVTAYKWWNDRSSQEYQTAQQMLKAFPELMRYPDYKLVVGDYIRGAKVREQESKASQKSPTIKKAQVQPTKPSSSPINASQKQSDTEAAKNRFAKSRNTDSLASVIKNQFL